MTNRQDLGDLMHGEMFELMAMIREKTRLKAPDTLLYCSFEDCGVAYIPSSRDNVGGMYWTCPGCARLTQTQINRLPDPDDR